MSIPGTTMQDPPPCATRAHVLSGCTQKCMHALNTPVSLTTGCTTFTIKCSCYSNQPTGNTMRRLTTRDIPISHQSSGGAVVGFAALLQRYAQEHGGIGRLSVSATSTPTLSNKDDPHFISRGPCSHQEQKIYPQPKIVVNLRHERCWSRANTHRRYKGPHKKIDKKKKNVLLYATGEQRRCSRERRLIGCKQLRGLVEVHQSYDSIQCGIPFMGSHSQLGHVRFYLRDAKTKRNNDGEGSVPS